MITKLYDLGSGTWTSSDSLRERRTRYTVTLLNNGKALVAGGWGRYGDPIESADIYDPDASRWSSAGKMAITRSDHSAVLLGNGKILGAGGAPENDTQMQKELVERCPLFSSNCPSFPIARKLICK